MKNFGYCIWFLPKNTKWNTFTNGFISHMTIKHSLTLSEAQNIYSKLNCISKTVKLIKNYTLSCEDNFHALYYTLEKIDNKPEWWPDNAHVSFLYKYKEQITNSEISHHHIHNISKICTFDKIALVDCNNKHFKDWKIIKSK